MDTTTLLLAIIVCLEPFLVVVVAPQVTRRVTERHATRFFEVNLLPRIEASLEARFRAVLGGLAPSPEAQAAAQAGVADAVGSAVRQAIADTVKGRMSALSAAGVDARSERKEAEAALRRAVMTHPKGGMPAVLGLSALKRADPDMFRDAAEAALMNPDAIGEFLDKHGDKLRLGFGGKEEKPKIAVV